MTAGQERRGSWRLPSLLLLCVLVVHAQSVRFEFVAYDDLTHVAGNPYLDPPRLAALARFWARPFEHLYVPLAYSVWGGIAAFSHLCTGRLDPAFFHGANVLLHAGVAWLVFEWLGKLLADRRAAFAGAMCFALHPLQVESVSWVSELRGLLAAALGFGALLQHERGRSWRALGMFALALLSKPSAVAFAPAALVIDLLWHARSWRPALARLWPWFLLAICAAAGSKLAQSDESLRYVTPWSSRPAVALDALGFYAQEFLWPAGLNADHGRSPQSVLAGELAWGGLASALALLLAALVLPERRRALAAPGFALAALSPVLGFVSFGFQEKSTVADRYAYLALAGAGLFAGACVRRWRTPAFAAVLAVAGVWAALSLVQAQSWRSTRTLFERVLEHNPRSVAAHDNLGLAALQRGDLPRAREHYRRALELRPDKALALNNLGLCECQLGDFENGMRHLRQALAVEPRYLRARANLVAGLGMQGKLEEAEREARALAGDEPANPQALLPLVQVLRARGQRAEAWELLQRVLTVLPDWKEALAEKRALGQR